MPEPAVRHGAPGPCPAAVTAERALRAARPRHAEAFTSGDDRGLAGTPVRGVARAVAVPAVLPRRRPGASLTAA